MTRPTAHRPALVLLALAGPLMLAAFVLGGDAGAVVFGVLAALVPVALAAVGAARGGRLGPLAVPFLLLAAALVATVLLLFHLRGGVATAPWLFGLPLAAAVQLGGLFLLPLLAVPLLYGLTFDRWTLPRHRPSRAAPSADPAGDA